MLQQLVQGVVLVQENCVNTCLINELLGKYGVYVSLIIVDPFLYDAGLDSRTNLFEEGGDDMNHSTDFTVKDTEHPQRIWITATWTFYLYWIIKYVIFGIFTCFKIT